MLQPDWRELGQGHALFRCEKACIHALPATWQFRDELLLLHRYPKDRHSRNFVAGRQTELGQGRQRPCGAGLAELRGRGGWGARSEACVCATGGKELLRLSTQRCSLAQARGRNQLDGSA
eukprot:1140305-Pelagomonas_calceolata.AAC.3